MLTSKEQDNNHGVIHLKQISFDLSPVNRRTRVATDANQKEINFQKVFVKKGLVFGVRSKIQADRSQKNAEDNA